MAVARHADPIGGTLIFHRRFAHSACIGLTGMLATTFLPPCSACRQMPVVSCNRAAAFA
jgi:hypothetical protein